MNLKMNQRAIWQGLEEVRGRGILQFPENEVNFKRN